jgi:probable rRNA maturation factor
MEIDIIIEEEGWNGRALESLATQACANAMEALGLESERFSVSILACGDDRIAALNEEFRGKSRPTNVLSWPAEERSAAKPGEMPRLPGAIPNGQTEELGDIALALGVITREAMDAGKPFDQHLTHLLVHGLLHLLGFDHMNEADATLMEGLETRILARLGVPDPY